MRFALELFSQLFLRLLHLAKLTDDAHVASWPFKSRKPPARHRRPPRAAGPIEVGGCFPPPASMSIRHCPGLIRDTGKSTWKITKKNRASQALSGAIRANTRKSKSSSPLPLPFHFLLFTFPHPIFYFSLPPLSISFYTPPAIEGRFSGSATERIRL